ncbi:MAG: TonB-dependent receptor [Opitutaceae bacterium]|nr:TonB-dependent receptor [Opitutaceae bacterium]
MIASSARCLLSLVSATLAAIAVAADAPPETAEKVDHLDPVNVQADRYRAVQPGITETHWPMLGFIFKFPGFLLPNLMGTMVVTASRSPEPPERVAASIRLFDADSIRHAPSLSLDAALRSAPGFSLFRRSDSLIANPTAQGVSLRGLGPSGASRSLLLLDGVPLNDPFGGWVAWTKVPREAVGKVEVVPGGGATAWGNAALGGAIQILSAPIRTEMIVVDRPPAPIAWGQLGTARFSALLGEFNTRSVEFVLNRPVGGGIVQLLGREFSTDGFSLVAPERRGAIDIPAWSRHRWLTGRWRHALGNKAEFTATVRSYEEKRGNGTPYQQNNSREKFVSLALAGQPAEDFAWNAVAYAQDQSFASTFSAVNATRTAETPASDQFDVPSVAAGGAWAGTWRHAGGARTTGGTDLRYVRGETRENFTFANGVFTRQRVAGGRQVFAGMFALHEQPLTENLRVTLGGRVDAWRDTDGHRRETDRITGAVLRADRYADRSDVELSPSAGFVWAGPNRWRIRGNAQHSFRRPTLNELYRPFRVGPNVTEANADLDTESATSAEFGAEYRIAAAPPPSAQPRDRRLETEFNPTAAQARRSLSAGTGTRRTRLPLLVVGATAFWNDLRDAVGNVTIARGPGTFPIVGFVASGGVGRQRLNLDRTEVKGLELSGRWAPLDTLLVSADYLYNDARVRRATVAPGLVGNRVAQVPRQSASIGATWLAPAQISVTPRLRWIGRQFEDDENQLVLGEVVIVDLGIARPLGKHLELFLNIENIGDVRIETGRTADGVVNLGTPRLTVVGIRGSW